MIYLYQIDNITKILIADKKLEWCRFMFAIYIKLPNGKFDRVSPPTFSDLIQQGINIDLFYFSSTILDFSI